MGRKENDSNRFTKTLATGVGAITELLFTSVFSRLEAGADILLRKTELRAMKMQERLMRGFSVAAAQVIGVMLLFLALFFYLVQVVGVPLWQSFLYVGILILLGGFYLKYKYLKDRKDLG